MLVEVTTVTPVVTDVGAHLFSEHEVVTTTVVDCCVLVTVLVLMMPVDVEVKVIGVEVSTMELLALVVEFQ